MSQIRMWLEEGEKLRLETETRLASIEEDEDHHHAQFLKEMDSVRRVLVAEGKGYAELDPLAMFMKAEGRRSAEMQNEMDPLAIFMKTEGKLYAELQNETDPLAIFMKAERKLYA
jgi:hypothetical protein